MQNSSSLQIWNQVPGGSTLELALTGDGAFVGRGVLAIEDVEAEQWPDEEIQPGPKLRPLNASDLSYSLLVFVGFAGSATATVEARIIAPGGGTFEDPYTHTMTGDGDEQHVAIFINMA